MVVVNDSEALKSALRNLSASGGWVFLANSELPYEIDLYDFGHGHNEIVISPAEVGGTARVSRVEINRAKNVRLQGLTFDSRPEYEDRDISVPDLMVRNCDGVTVTGCTFIAAADGLYTGADAVKRATSVGTIRDSKRVVFTGNEVSNYMQGPTFWNVQALKVSGNHIHHMQGDGLRFMGVQDAMVEANTIEAPYATGQDINHTDMIQVMAGQKGTQNTENLSILRNRLTAAGGVATQSIFIKREGSGARYKNIKVIGNVITNGHQHGISMSNVSGGEVSGNLLVWNKASGVLLRPDKEPQNSRPTVALTDCPGVTADGNLSAALEG